MPVGLNKPRRDVIINDFAGGLNSYFPENRIADNSSAQMQNCLVNEDGVLTRRAGITKIGAESLTTDEKGSIVDLIVAGTGDKKKAYLLYREVETAEKAGNICSYDGGEEFLDELADASAKIQDGNMCWVRELGELGDADTITERIYIAGSHPDTTSNEVGRVKITAKGGAPALASVFGYSAGNPNFPPLNATAITNVQGRVWLGGITDNLRHIVFYSKFLTAQTWDRAINAVAFDSPSGQGSTGLAPYRDNMVFVGMEDACFLLAVGTASVQLDWAPIIISNDIGCGSHKTIANVGEDLFFMDQYGNIRSLSVLAQSSGTSVRNMPISIPIKDHTDAIDPDLMYQANSAYHNSNYWLSFPKTDGSWNLFNFNTVTRQWSGPHILNNAVGDPLEVRAMTSFSGDLGAHPLTSKGRRLYFATDDNKGTHASLEIYELDSSATKDDGEVDIELDLISKAYDFGAPHQDKVLDWAEVTYEKVAGDTGVFTVSCRADHSSDWVEVAKVDYTRDPAIQEHKFNLKMVGRGRKFQFRIQSTDANTNLRVINFVVRMRGYEPKSAG